MINRYFRRQLCPLITRIFHGKLYIKIQSKKKKYMAIHAFIPYLLSACATLTVKMDTKLNDNIFSTLTSKFQGQMVNRQCLKNAWPNLHETKAMWINWLIHFIYDLDHWPCLWHWPWISKVKSWNCHIYEISDLIAKKGRISWMVWYFVNNIWPTFWIHHMLQCHSGVTFLSLATSVWSYIYRNGDGVQLGHNTFWCAVLGFTPYTKRLCMKFAKFRVTRTQIRCNFWPKLLHIFNNIWKADRLMEGWLYRQQLYHVIKDKLGTL